MNIRYQKPYDNDFDLNYRISNELAEQMGCYEKVFLDDNDRIIKKEFHDEGVLKKLYHYNYKNEDHRLIIDRYRGTFTVSITIKEFSRYEDLLFEKLFIYGDNGDFVGTLLLLYDEQKTVIASGYKDENGRYEYDTCHKYYYDRALNPDDYIFECTFNENGELLELYWNNRHIDDTEQESFVLFNTPEDKATLIKLTSMAEAMIEYYMQPEVDPFFINKSKS